MDGRNDGWKEGWMDRWKEGRKKEWMEGLMERWKDGWKERWKEERKKEWVGKVFGSSNVWFLYLTIFIVPLLTLLRTGSPVIFVPTASFSIVTIASILLRVVICMILL